MRWALCLVAFAVLSLTGGVVEAKGARSIGSPSEGTLVGGKKIEQGANLRLVGHLRYALPDLVAMLEASADRVAKKHPGAVLTVGDLSAKDGGDVDGHRSHESGRDADVGFYLLKGKKPFSAKRFATIDEDGKAKGLPGVRFDDERNWTLVESWLTSRRGRVLQIFVANHVRARLLAAAARAGAPAHLRARAAEVLMQPKKALPHDNHYHLRIACPPKDRACVTYAKRQKVAEAKAKKIEKKAKTAKKEKETRAPTKKRTTPRRQATRVNVMSASSR